MKYAGVCLLIAGVLFAVTSRWIGGNPESVAVAGTHYTVTVLRPIVSRYG
ncbi:hypothetical protein [Nonomuraea turcica]|nr:hypothetical protein [Nonomuraea sp. G32]MDP4511233.1 hypothetical protein [Nonomuraea sp. G32]